MADLRLIVKRGKELRIATHAFGHSLSARHRNSIARSFVHVLFFLGGEAERHRILEWVRAMAGLRLKRKIPFPKPCGEIFRQSNDGDVGLLVAAKRRRGAPEAVRYAVGPVLERCTEEPSHPVLGVAVVEGLDDMPARKAVVEPIMFNEGQCSVLDAGIQQLRDFLYVDRYDS